LKINATHIAIALVGLVAVTSGCLDGGEQAPEDDLEGQQAPPPGDDFEEEPAPPEDDFEQEPAPEDDFGDEPIE